MLQPAYRKLWVETAAQPKLLWPCASCNLWSHCHWNDCFNQVCNYSQSTAVRQNQSAISLQPNRVKLVITCNLLMMNHISYLQNLVKPDEILQITKVRSLCSGWNGCVQAGLIWLALLALIVSTCQSLVGLGYNVIRIRRKTAKSNMRTYPLWWPHVPKDQQKVALFLWPTQRYWMWSYLVVVAFC